MYLIKLYLKRIKPEQRFFKCLPYADRPTYGTFRVHAHIGESNSKIGELHSVALNKPSHLL